MTAPTGAANTCATSGPPDDPPTDAPIAGRLPAAAADAPGAANALAVVRHLARSQHLPAELIAVMDGALADAVAVAADYAGDSITAATRAASTGTRRRA